MNLKGTKTAVNLMKAFAGESQARNRYTYYASVADKEGYKQVRNIFLETADNEKEHAKRFYKFLLAGLDELPADVEIQASFPVAQGNTADNLKAAAAGEYEEWAELYPMFADEAEEEGFQKIADVFRYVADAEKWHDTRYKKLLANIENNEVFKREGTVYWKCGNCGYVHEGLEAIDMCPACDHAQAHFELYANNY